MSLALSPAMPDYAVAGDGARLRQCGLRLTTAQLYETAELAVKSRDLYRVAPAVVNHVAPLFFRDRERGAGR